MSDKVIVTNLGVLTKKYGASGLKQIQQALAALIKADKARDLTTRTVALDDAKAMKAFGAPAVTKSGDPKQNKNAIDAVCKALNPDYLVILGGPDVIPHQDMKNPIYKKGDDDDLIAFGDLPYACPARYSQDPKDFLGPVRVTGRIPDAPKATDPALLLALLGTAAKWVTRDKPDYSDYLGISAEVWKGSTGLSLQNIYGNNTSLKLAPPGGPQWTGAELAPRSHFINCHGAPSDFHFYGQHGNKYPESHDASWIKGKVTAGTVIAAECCYGAELFDPADTKGQMGICLQYLNDGAYAFFGSTTIAYGPADGNGSADLICQYFHQRVLAGASTGRAVLEARQQFVQNASMTDPADLKTLAQFNLLGDPSIQPVTKLKPQFVPLDSIAKAFGAKAGSKTMLASASAARKDRRRSLFMSGSMLTQNQPCAVPAAPGALKTAMRKALNKLADEAGITQSSVQSFNVETPSAANQTMAKGMKSVASVSALFHLLMGSAAGPEGNLYTSLLIAREVDGSIVSVRRLFGKTPLKQR